MEVIARRTADAAAFARAKSGEKAAVVTAALDCVFLAGVVGLSLLLYVRGLGFYYDDYSVLARMSAAHDHSLLGLYHAVRPLNGQRPLQSLTFATLYRLFGLAPLGYHVVNACLLVAVAVLLYLVLRELRLPRVVCVALPLLYSTLPHYATDRFWLDAFQINVSSAFYLLNLYAGLRAARASRASLGPWLAMAALAVAASVLAYEVVFPLFALNVGLAWWASRRVTEESDRTTGWLVVGTLAISVLAVGLAKTALVAEHGQNGYRLGVQDGLLHHLAYLVSGAIKLNVGTYFLALPYVLWWIVWHRFSAAATAVAAISGLIAFAYLWHISRRDPNPFQANRVWRALLGIGALTFVLGYAVFLVNQNVLFRSAGIDNRVNAGAALGIAGMLVGAIGLLASRADARRGAVVFSATIACAVATGVFVIDAVASFWTTAAQQQRAIVSAVSRAADAVPPSSTVILDGVCPEVGPAVVFANQWDFRGALQLAQRDPSLEGDVASESLRAKPDRLSLEMTFLDHVYTRSYPYGRRLFVYDFSQRRLYPLPNRSQASTYLARSRPSFHCLPQRGFAWGFDPEYRWTLL